MRSQRFVFSGISACRTPPICNAPTVGIFKPSREEQRFVEQFNRRYAIWYDHNVVRHPETGRPLLPSDVAEWLVQAEKAGLAGSRLYDSPDGLARFGEMEVLYASKTTGLPVDFIRRSADWQRSIGWGRVSKEQLYELDAERRRQVQAIDDEWLAGQ